MSGIGDCTDQGEQRLHSVGDPQEHQRALGIILMKGPRRKQLIMTDQGEERFRGVGHPEERSGRLHHRHLRIGRKFESNVSKSVPRKAPKSIA